MNTRTQSRPRRSGSRVSGRTFSKSNNRRSGGGFRRGGASHQGQSRNTGGSRGGRRGGGRKMPTFDPSQFINKNPVELTETVYTPTHTFDTFGLNPKLAYIIKEMGITTPSAIQDQVIPEILSGKDVIGLAETGTGKTAAFLIPVVEKTLHNPHQQTLILTPTRELALQVNEELRKLTKGFRIFSTTCVGGMNILPQLRSLKRTNQFIIGTPGRILDLINRGSIVQKNLTTVILDEADRMFDMGFLPDTKRILSGTPKNRTTLLFSATMSPATNDLVKEFLNNPVTISVKKKDVTNSIEQDVVLHGHHNKFETLTALLEDNDFKRVIVFGAMKHSVQKLSEELRAHGITAEAIHGNKSHSQRQRSLKNFKDSQARVLVATDVAARGIHVDNVSHVINYDLPGTFEDYVHRIGRTGRGNKRGKALTFIAE